MNEKISFKELKELEVVKWLYPFMALQPFKRFDSDGRDEIILVDVDDMEIVHVIDVYDVESEEEVSELEILRMIREYDPKILVPLAIYDFIVYHMDSHSDIDVFIAEAKESYPYMFVHEDGQLEAYAMLEELGLFRGYY